MFNIPTLVTLVRILIVPVMIWVAISGDYVWFKPCFLIGAVSDWLDGFLARRLKQTTNLGAILDPIADKFFVCGWYFIFGFLHTPYSLPKWFVNFIFFKEFLLIFGAIFLTIKYGTLKIVPSTFAKILMALYSVLIFSVLQSWTRLNNILIYLIVALSFVVLVDYAFKEKKYV